MNTTSTPRFRKAAAYTLIELMAVIFITTVPAMVGQLVSERQGRSAGIAAGIVCAGACLIIVVCGYRLLYWWMEKERRQLREKYRYIYRVISLPAADRSSRKAPGAEILPGDAGWEAKPLARDGLIYLQGLDPRWRVVWHAGFRPDQIEKIATKPQSQYDWDYTWERNPPPCPFPIQARETPTLGLPLW